MSRPQATSTLTRLQPFTPLEWVSVVPMGAFFSISCSRCGVTDVVYHAGALRDPSLLAHTHDTHRLCLPKEKP